MIFLTDLILFKRGCHPNIYVCQMIDLPGQGMSVEAKERQVTQISQDDTGVLIQVSRIFQQVFFFTLFQFSYLVVSLTFSMQTISNRRRYSLGTKSSLKRKTNDEP